MKVSVLCQLGTSALLAAAQPGIHRRHADFHHKRGAIATVVEVVHEFVQVIVEGESTTTSTVLSTETVTPSTAASAPSVAAAAAGQKDAGGPQSFPSASNSSPVNSPAAINTPTAAPNTYVPPAPPAYPSSTSTAAAQPAPVQSKPPSSPGAGNSGSASGLGVAYSPYGLNKGGDNCRPDVQGDIQKIIAKGYSFIRIYTATDCSLLAKVASAIASSNSNMKIILNPMGNSKQTDLDTLTSNGAWTSALPHIYAVIVSNEAGSGAADQTKDLVNKYKGIYGNQFLVGAAEAFGQMTSEVAGASDFCAVNLHAFQQPDCTGGAADAGNCVIKKMGQPTFGCTGNKPIIISESGWPSAGVPESGWPSPGPSGYTPDQQATAIAALSKLPGTNNISSLMLFMAFDDPSKGPGMCEQKLGFMGPAA